MNVFWIAAFIVALANFIIVLIKTGTAELTLVVWILFIAGFLWKVTVN